MTKEEIIELIEEEFKKVDALVDKSIALKKDTEELHGSEYDSLKLHVHNELMRNDGAYGVLKSILERIKQ